MTKSTPKHEILKFSNANPSTHSLDAVFCKMLWTVQRTKKSNLETTMRPYTWYVKCQTGGCAYVKRVLDRVIAPAGVNRRLTSLSFQRGGGVTASSVPSESSTVVLGCSAQPIAHLTHSRTLAVSNKWSSLAALAVTCRKWWVKSNQLWWSRSWQSCRGTTMCYLHSTCLAWLWDALAILLWMLAWESTTCREEACLMDRPHDQLVHDAGSNHQRNRWRKENRCSSDNELWFRVGPLDQYALQRLKQ